MFLAHVTMGRAVLERNFFGSFKEAERWARDRKDDKVCRIDHMVFMGEPMINIYELSMKVTSNHMDRPIAII
jgi:hypothetical protein